MDKRKLFIGGGLLAAAASMALTGAVGGVVGYMVATRFPNLLPGQTVTTAAGRLIQVTEEESAVIAVVDESSPAVVSIVGKGFNPFSGSLDEQSAGTGFIVDSGGIIVTNAHVVSDSTNTYTVITRDKKTYTARQISSDPVNDIAIVKIDGQGLPTLPLGDSSSLKVGQDVVAIGNALGKFDNTVSTGVVSGLGRQLTLSASESFDDLIQTDAAINPGNSGGPLLNLAGEVIGVNFAKASAENVGFAIPINTAKAILANYQKNGRIVRAYLGVRTQTVTADSAAINQIPEGAYVFEVGDNSPADKAGIKSGDVLTEIAGKKINEDYSLARAIAAHSVGETVSIQLYRNGKTLTVTAKLTEAT